MKNFLKSALTVAFAFALAAPIFGQQGHFYTTQEELLPKQENLKFLYHNGFEIQVMNMYNKPDNIFMVMIMGPMTVVDTSSSTTSAVAHHVNYTRQMFMAEVRLESDYKLTVIKLDAIEYNNPKLIEEEGLESVVLEAVLHAKNINDAARPKK